MKYLLDSNMVIEMIRRPHGKVAALIQDHSSTNDVGISSIVKHELYFGAYRSQHCERNLKVVSLLDIEELGFIESDANEAARVRANLAELGTPIGPYDTLIAGHALSRGLTLVTHNVREFSRVEGLQIEDWLADQSPP